MNKGFLIKQKENMKGPLQKEKREVIDKIENWLVDNIKSESDFAYVSSVRSMIDAIVYSYWSKCYNSETNREDWRGYGNLAASDWLEKISNAQNKDEVKLMERVLITLITTFNSKETEKFREIERKIKELRQETFPEGNKGKIDKNKVLRLINELQPFATSISNKEHGEFPVVSNVFYNQIESAIRTAKWRMNNEEPKTAAVNSQGKENQISDNGENDKKRKDRNNELDNGQEPKKAWNEANLDVGSLVSEKTGQEKEDADKKISDILAAAKNETDLNKLANSLEQIEKENGGNEMEESKKREIKELKEKLLSSDSQAKQKLIDKLNNSLVQNGLSKGELDEGTRKELESLNSEENNEEIIKKEVNLTEKIGLTGAKKKLDELVEKAKGYLAKNLFNKVREVKKEVVQFISDKGYNHKAYLANKSEVDQLFAQAENKASEKPQEPAWKKVVVPVSLSIGAVALVVGIAIIARKKRQKRD